MMLESHPKKQHRFAKLARVAKLSRPAAPIRSIDLSTGAPIQRSSLVDGLKPNLTGGGGSPGSATGVAGGRPARTLSRGRRWKWLAIQTSRETAAGASRSHWRFRGGLVDAPRPRPRPRPRPLEAPREGATAEAAGTPLPRPPGGGSGKYKDRVPIEMVTSTKGARQRGIRNQLRLGGPIYLIRVRITKTQLVCQFGLRRPWVAPRTPNFGYVMRPTVSLGSLSHYIVVVNASDKMSKRSFASFAQAMNGLG
ncbi:hypothetical protein PRK78_003997 [Emydomyces testavorans]|uniref:Uncharacterized protein n=1 Tax=Emydomyces testavorans TaxID=2070801 RepID=A0AAF0IL55_9EURO|nr:hypothetical protein PRK78_003997 [Emydomyces testavorans]